VLIIFCLGIAITKCDNQHNDLLSVIVLILVLLSDIIVNAFMQSIAFWECLMSLC
jgi:hypothetical protein